MKPVCSVSVLFLVVGCFTNVLAYNTYVVDHVDSFPPPDVVRFDHKRVRREAPAPPRTTTMATSAPVANTNAPAVIPSGGAPAPSAVNASVINQSEKVTDDSNRTDNDKSTTLVTATVTQIPLLGQNGTGILKVNLTTNTPKVSDPISATDNLNVFSETPERLKTEQNIPDLQYDNHNFYNSTFIANQTYFDEYWANITQQPADVHAVLSNSHRRASTLKLRFEFPFYGQILRNITVATGGFIYTGEHVHNWLAATQYIAPLMANFDTTLTADSSVRMYDTGDKFTVFWINVTLQEDISKKFTFAVTLYKNGDIVFAYKDIPTTVQNINDSDHPVKVGISDAYLTDRILFLVRRKTIYEYHRVSFKNHPISSGTILKLTALPTCLQYDDCVGCVNHNTGFDCMWCDAIQKCSSGTDRNKQDWMFRNCDRIQISNETNCPTRFDASHRGNPAYVTDAQPPNQDTLINNLNPQPNPRAGAGGVAQPAIGAVHPADVAPHSAVGSVVGALVALTLVCCGAAWTLYAFKNPHTRSGQLLIKYRPSQWSWRRGEARYTAATIHM